LYIGKCIPSTFLNFIIVRVHLSPLSPPSVWKQVGLKFYTQTPHIDAKRACTRFQAGFTKPPRKILISLPPDKNKKIWSVTFLVLIYGVYEQKFSTLASKLREEFKVT